MVDPRLGVAQGTELRFSPMELEHGFTFLTFTTTTLVWKNIPDSMMIEIGASTASPLSLVCFAAISDDPLTPLRTTL